MKYQQTIEDCVTLAVRDAMDAGFGNEAALDVVARELVAAVGKIHGHRAQDRLSFEIRMLNASTELVKS